MSNKCLIWVRASTDRQETESQLKETIDYAKSLGFDEFEIIDKAGASAYKVNKQYIEMIDEMKSKILADPDIKAVVCWHLNRLARNESMAMNIKDFLVQNKIQLYVNEPTIKLFNNDGTINEGAELIFNLFATMSKQQISELRQKVKRAKKRDMAARKYIGGPVVSFGYFVDTDKYVKPHPTDSKIIQDIFNLYATGEYSYATLMAEINERYATNFTSHYMYTVLHNKRYYDGVMYEPIITEEQYRKAEEKRDANNFKPMQSKHRHFANRLIKCPICGRGLTGNIRDYRCTNACGKSMSISNLDGILWLISSHLESERLLNASAKDDYVQKKAVLVSKIKSVDSTTRRFEKARQTAKEMALRGYIELEELETRMRQLDNDEKEVKQKVDKWKTEIAELDRLINEDIKDIKRVLQLSDNISLMDEQEMRSLVRRWIKRIDFEGNIFTIKTLTRTYKAVYNRYDRQYNRWFTVSGRQLAVRPFERDKDGCSFGANRCTVSDIPITLAWLNGSEVV